MNTNDAVEFILLHMVVGACVSLLGWTTVVGWLQVPPVWFILGWLITWAYVTYKAIQAGATLKVSTMVVLVLAWPSLVITSLFD